MAPPSTGRFCCARCGSLPCFRARFADPGLDEVAPAVEDAISRMMQQQEPYPLTVLSGGYDIVRSNRAARALFAHFVAEPALRPTPLNMFSLLFDPCLVRPFVRDWAHVGHRMIARLHRETLQGRPDDRLRALIQRTLAYPDVPQGWRRPDFSRA